MYKNIIFSLTLLYLLFSSNFLIAQYSLEIIIQSKLPDNIQVFYLPRGNKTFSRENSFSLPIHGSEIIDTLNFSIPVKSIEGLRIDFGLIKNEFKIKQILLSNNTRKSYWPAEYIINSFIANSNMNIVRVNKGGYSFTTNYYKGRFDPNMVLNKNGKNKISFDFNKGQKMIIKNEFLITAKSPYELLAFLWIVPQSLEKENYYLLPNRSSFMINKTDSIDSIRVNLYTVGFISAFSLDFGKNYSKSIFINSIEFKDKFRHKSWDAARINQEFIFNTNIIKTLFLNTIKLNMVGYQKYVGPRIEFRFDMLKLTYYRNSFEINIGGKIFFINIFILLLISSFVLLYFFNKMYFSNSNIKND